MLTVCSLCMHKSQPTGSGQHSNAVCSRKTSLELSSPHAHAVVQVRLMMTVSTRAAVAGLLLSAALQQAGATLEFSGCVRKSFVIQLHSCP